MLASRGAILLRTTLYTSDVYYTPAENGLVDGLYVSLRLPWCSNSKESTGNAGDPCLIPGSGRFPAERNGYALQYSCLENPMDRGVWRATVRGVAKSQT